jgi:hypothetical protein
MVLPRTLLKPGEASCRKIVPVPVPRSEIEQLLTLSLAPEFCTTTLPARVSYSRVDGFRADLNSLDVLCRRIAE